MGDELLTPLVGAGEHAVSDAEGSLPLLLDDPELRRGRIGVPLLRRAEDVAAVVCLDDPQHRDTRYSACLVEGTGAAGLDQALVRHVVEQALECDLAIAAKPERARNFALACGLVRRRDEIEDLLAAGKFGGTLAGHSEALNAPNAAGYPCCRGG